MSPPLFLGGALGGRLPRLAIDPVEGARPTVAVVVPGLEVTEGAGC